MKIGLWLGILLSGLAFAPLPAQAHGGEEDEAPPLITYPSPAGMDVVIGRDNPVPVLEPEIITGENGASVKVFRLTVEDVKFEIYPGKTVEGWGFNGTVPGPVIRVKEGDRIRVVLTNKTRDEHTLHIHGQKKSVVMDGVPFLGQMPVKENESYTYEFEAVRAGTHWYHCHVDSGHHVDMGMYGAFIVDPKTPLVEADREYTLILDEWPTGHVHVHEGSMPMPGHETGKHGVMTEHKGAPRHDAAPLAMPPAAASGPQRSWYPKTYRPYTPVYDTFVINGRAFPYTEPLDVREGERVRIRLINAGYEPHFFHTHAHTFLAVARDGAPVPSPQRLDTVEVGPGQRVDILLTADNPGVWPVHCHRLTHVANDNSYPGGMLTFIRYMD